MPSNGEWTHQQRLTTARSLSWSAMKIPVTSMMQKQGPEAMAMINCRHPQQMNDVDADDDGDEQKSGYS
jgi:hypothetical protein